MTIVYISPAMKIDNLEQYLSVREALIQEKAELEARLSRIQEALGEASQSPDPMPARRKSTASSESRRGRPPAGGQSLREVVVGVLNSSGPLTKQEVLEKVMRTGYKFTTTNPLNSLGVILYGKGNGFKRENGRFTIQGGAARKSSPVSNGEQNGSTEADAETSTGGRKMRRRGPRVMSETAKARISAAAKLRWKKAKAEGKSSL